ncbi:MAG: hypothetical protein KIT44_10085 [Opitutaceae bacterium]|nr:hypothetical protein [Opitutaceae bacterium]
MSRSAASGDHGRKFRPPLGRCVGSAALMSALGLGLALIALAAFGASPEAEDMRFLLSGGAGLVAVGGMLGGLLQWWISPQWVTPEGVCTNVWWGGLRLVRWEEIVAVRAVRWVSPPFVSLAVRGRDGTCVFLSRMVGGEAGFLAEVDKYAPPGHLLRPHLGLR